jgi:hypothetical protein
MEDVKIILSALWVATELTYLYGDMLRILSGDSTKMLSGEMQFTQTIWLGIAVLMAIPIVMVVASLTLPYSVNRWVNIIAAIFFFGFNLIGLPTYPSAYDKFLLMVSMGFNLMTVWYAWNWI